MFELPQVNYRFLVICILTCFVFPLAATIVFSCPRHPGPCSNTLRITSLRNHLPQHPWNHILVKNREGVGASLRAKVPGEGSFRGKKVRGILNMVMLPDGVRDCHDSLTMAGRMIDRFRKAEEFMSAMKLVSVNTGLPREVTWRGTNVTTAIYKQPVKGRVTLRKLNLDGDRQADLSVHGGEHKAVYCYPLEHYSYWKKELPGRELPVAIFGENFTTEGLLEDSVHLGDQFSVGSAEVVVTQPRLPCYKLGVRFQSEDMVKRFLASGRTGFYVAVTREGEVGAGDEITVIARDPNALPIREIIRLYVAKTYGDAEEMLARRALRIAAFPDGWKAHCRERLEQQATGSTA